MDLCYKLSRNIIVILFFLLLYSLVNAQEKGITFFHGSWPEVLQEAKKTNRLVFVDAYAVWCKPCKMMANEVFTDSAVAAYYNSNFINYKMDVETEEGDRVADKYKVKEMPSYLFIDADENLRYRSLGYLLPDAFIKLGMNALDPKKQYRVKD